MGTILILHIEVEDVDPALVDPMEYASMNWIECAGDTTSEILDAEWKAP
jgi:hypothetical protein